MSDKPEVRIEWTGGIQVHYPVTFHTARTETAVSCA